MAQLKYAIMLWVGDSMKMSVHHLKFVTIPKKPWNAFKRGDAGWSRYPGTSEEWEFKVLAVGEERQNLTKELDKYLKDPAKVIDQLNLEFLNNETEEESQSILTPPVTDNKLDEPQEQSTRHRVRRVIPPIESDSEKSEEHEHEEVNDDSDKDEDFLPPKNKKQRHEESTTDENASGKAKVKKSKNKKQKQKKTDETDEVKKARKDFCLLKRQKEKLSNETSSMMSRNLLSEDNSMIDELNLLTSAVRDVQSSQVTIMARLDSFIETFQCRDCIKQVVKEYKIAVKSGSTPGKEKASKPEEQPQTSKPEEQPQTSKPEKAEQQTSKSEEPIGDISGIEVNESEENKTTLDDVEHFESNTDALVCLGETRYGIKMKSADLARCEEQSQTAEKFVLNLLEYLVTKLDCQAMTVYGHGKNKREMDPQMRKAIRSHMFSLYKREMSPEEKNKVLDGYYCCKDQ